MGFGEWPEAKNLFDKYQLFDPDLGVIYQNTTPYPQLVKLRVLAQVQSGGAVNLAGDSILFARVGPVSPPVVGGGSSGLSITLGPFAASASTSLNQYGLIVLLVPAGWYWTVFSQVSGHGLEPAYSGEIYGPVTPTYTY